MAGVDDGIATDAAASPAEHLSLGSGAQLKIRVNFVEPTGPEIQIFGTLGKRSIVGLFRDRITPATGSELELTVDPGQVHLFASETGQRLN